MSDKNHPDPGPGWRIASGDDWKDLRCEWWMPVSENWDSRVMPGEPFGIGDFYRIPIDAPQPELYYLVKGDIMSAEDEWENWMGTESTWEPSSASSDTVGKPFDPAKHAPRRRRVTKPEPVESATKTTPVENALAVLSDAMQNDSDYAWSWHCNVAMAAVDAGAPICEANERAADLIKHAFGVDVRASEQWKNMPMPAVDTVPPGDNNSPTHDPVYQPAHYTQGPIECVDWVRLGLTPEEYRGWLKGTAMGYLFRERLKGVDEDLAKAAQFLMFNNRPSVNFTKE